MTALQRTSQPLSPTHATAGLQQFAIYTAVVQNNLETLLGLTQRGVVLFDSKESKNCELISSTLRLFQKKLSVDQRLISRMKREQGKTSKELAADEEEISRAITTLKNSSPTSFITLPRGEPLSHAVIKKLFDDIASELIPEITPDVEKLIVV